MFVCVIDSYLESWVFEFLVVNCVKPGIQIYGWKQHNEDFAPF